MNRLHTPADLDLRHTRSCIEHNTGMARWEDTRRREEEERGRRDERGKEKDSKV